MTLRSILSRWRAALPKRPRDLRLPRGRVARLLAAIVLGLLGAAAGLTLAGRTSARIGPFDTTVAVRPAAYGETTIAIPPLGSLRFDTHDSPVGVGVRVDGVQVDEARALIRGPADTDEVTAALTRDTREALREAVVRAAAGALAGAFLLVLVVTRRRRSAYAGTAAALVAVLGLGGATAATWQPRALSEPRFTGVLTSAPRVIGDTRQAIDNFERYRAQLGRLVGNVATLYEAGLALPAYQADPSTIRLLHVSDLHLNPEGMDLVARLVEEFAIEAVVDTGDMTDFGTNVENQFAARIGSLGVPYAYVKGNHDSPLTARAIAAQPNAVVLDGGDVREVAGVRMAGFGDPRFTADKSTGDDENQKEIISDFAGTVAARIAEQAEPPDLLAIHDPIAAEDVLGDVPLVLAGHRHRFAEQRTGETVLLVQGSTGGAGLRALEGEEPTPLVATVLYLDRATKRLEAYDRVIVAGLGGSSVELRRHLVSPAETPRGLSRRDRE